MKYLERYLKEHEKIISDCLGEMLDMPDSRPWCTRTYANKVNARIAKITPRGSVLDKLLRLEALAEAKRLQGDLENFEK